MEPLTFIANPGSASRKYAFFVGSCYIGSLHYEHEEDNVVCTVLKTDAVIKKINVPKDLDNALDTVIPLANKYGLIKKDDPIGYVGLRVVAPSGFFLEDRIIDSAVHDRLKDLKLRAPLHINATLKELDGLQKNFPKSKIIGISDSAFHKSKPDYSWNYGLPLDLADKLEIKRFGYHGLSVEAAIRQLQSKGLSNGRLIVCHLGSGSSITAIKNGVSIDNSMGYSPLEGLMMATRSGNIDPIAVMAIKQEEGISDKEIELLLNKKSGLLGVSGISSDIRVLLKEENTHYRAKLALSMYVHGVQRAIGQMLSVLGGVDSLVFTGTVGERSSIIRQRIMKNFGFLELSLSPKATVISPTMQCIGHQGGRRAVFVIGCDEMLEMATHVKRFV